ncbi:MAG: hypothetical protein ACNS62_17905 [Candidatus Cyclobacteriaceae bacterium M3_2C_046]
MKAFDKKIAIPSYLHELHGKEASIFDLLVNYSTALITTVIILFLAWDLSLAPYKLIILGVLALDLAGGVVSNFTEGTNNYYIEKPKIRYVFIAFHLMQPLVLIWLFPTDWVGIAVISVYTLIAMTVINSIKEHLRQRVYGAFLMVIGLSISFLIDEMQPIVQLMLILFIVKLIVAFAIRWK